jgi:hypothetical protein
MGLSGGVPNEAIGESLCGSTRSRERNRGRRSPYLWGGLLSNDEEEEKRVVRAIGRALRLCR